MYLFGWNMARFVRKCPMDLAHLYSMGVDIWNLVVFLRLPEASAWKSTWKLHCAAPWCYHSLFTKGSLVRKLPSYGRRRVCFHGPRVRSAKVADKKRTGP